MGRTSRDESVADAAPTAALLAHAAHDVHGTRELVMTNMIVQPGEGCSPRGEPMTDSVSGTDHSAHGAHGPGRSYAGPNATSDVHSTTHDASATDSVSKPDEGDLSQDETTNDIRRRVGAYAMKPDEGYSPHGEPGRVF